ncbi:hypothetical protein [Aquibium oceanicum]|uniref:DUF2946 domain-containing protein n=1 Tax=Aquibium oceanicum TaxID=1670800 RepID=A0A1L3SZJ7_9HYPH|nr:hypothetical protein [Aquibium oceanicum]APH74859.1 hypothetical protein BSQ44_25470 [Aquibium oceanicum]
MVRDLGRICRSDNTAVQAHDSAMRSLGISRARGVAGFALTLLLAYLFLLQGLAVAYAKTLMATDQFGPSFVICAPSGKTEQPLDDPLEHMAGECCKALCEAVSAVGPIIEPSPSLSPLAFPLVIRAKEFKPGAQRAPPGEPGTIPEARGPPHFSI